jgi:hypothetical protein
MKRQRLGCVLLLGFLLFGLVAQAASDSVDKFGGQIRGQTELTPMQPGYTACRWSASNTTFVA